MSPCVLKDTKCIDRKTRRRRKRRRRRRRRRRREIKSQVIVRSKCE